MRESHAKTIRHRLKENKDIIHGRNVMKTSDARTNEILAAQQYGKQKSPKMSAEGSFARFYVHKTKTKNSPSDNS